MARPLRCAVRFYTTVFLPPTRPELVIEALTAALAPFDYNDYLREPFDDNAAWDRWQPPGRDWLPLLPAHAGDPHAVRVDGVVVAAPKAMVDFVAVHREAREEAAGLWDAWADLVRRHPGTLPRAHFARLHGDPGRGEAEWLLQPAVQEVAQAAATQEHPHFSFAVLTADPAEFLAGDRDAYLALASAEAFATYAYVTLGGDWLTEYTGDRGWATHVLEMSAYVDALPDDAMIARAWCHM